MKRFLSLLALTFLSANLMAADANKAITLEGLLEQVKKEGTKNSAQNQKRERTFRAAKNRQAQLLKDSKEQLAYEDAKSKRLVKQFTDNEKALEVLTNDLRVKSGNIGLMNGVVRQVAGDASARFSNSIISAQFPGRNKLMDELAANKKLPEIPGLRSLWVALLTEMTQQAQIVNFTTDVIASDGSRAPQNITRVGAFNLLSDDAFLLYKDDEVQALQRQPDSEFTSLVKPFTSQSSGYHSIALDRSKGVLLSLLIQKKTIPQYYHQGGIVGYVITGLFLFALFIVLIRVLGLTVTGGKIRSQMKSSTPANNPLGRIMKVYLDNRDVDVENLELKLDEAILKETPKLESWITTIKVIAALSPLLGLLGTVTGMIGTFQAITLFGTSDPKMMAGGISTALVTTVLGLVSAIPLIFLHSIVSGQSKGLVHILEEQSAGLIAQHAEKEG